MRTDILYALDKKGKIRTWRQFDKQGTAIITEAGLMGGTKTAKTTNFSSPNAQQLKANRNFEDKLNEGYKTLNSIVDKYEQVTLQKVKFEFGSVVTGIEKMMDVVCQYPTNAHWEPLPMLAKKIVDLNKVKYPVYAQRKYDGVRCLAQVRDKQVIFVSRGGLYYSFPHLEREILEINKKYSLEGVWLDGEIYKHGVPFADISGAARTDRDGLDLFGDKKSFLEYHIYDVFLPMYQGSAFQHRLKEITIISSFLGNGSKIIPVTTTLLPDPSSVVRLHEQFVQEGYEGTILRSQGGKYEAGYRSSDLMKWKDFFEDEYPIVGMDVDLNDISTFTFILHDEQTDSTFGCRPVGTHELWSRYARDINRLKGKMATVRYLNLSVNGIPEKANVKAIRDYE